MNYGERLKMYRKHANLTQKQLADLINVDNTTISRWEKGEYKLDVEKLKDLAIALNVTANDLLGFYTDFSLSPGEESILKIYRKLGDKDKEIILKLSEALNALREKETQQSAKHINSYVSYPVFDIPASAGTGQFLDSDDFEIMDFQEKYVPKSTTFAIRVSGDSMSPVYKDQSIVFVQRTKFLNPGDVGIFILNNEGFIKELGSDKSLISYNPKYKPIKIQEFDDIRIIGKVVGKYEK